MGKSKLPLSKRRAFGGKRSKKMKAIFLAKARRQDEKRQSVCEELSNEPAPNTVEVDKENAWGTNEEFEEQTEGNSSSIKTEPIDIDNEEGINLESNIIHKPSLDIKCESYDDFPSNFIEPTTDPLDCAFDSTIKHETEPVSGDPNVSTNNKEKVLLLVVEGENSSPNQLPEPFPPPAQKEVSITCADCNPPVHFNSFGDFKIHVAQNHKRTHVFVKKKTSSIENPEIPAETANPPNAPLESDNLLPNTQPLKTYSNKMKLKVTYSCPFCDSSKIPTQSLLNVHLQLFHQRRCDQFDNIKVKFKRTDTNSIMEAEAEAEQDTEKSVAFNEFSDEKIQIQRQIEALKIKLTSIKQKQESLERQKTLFESALLELQLLYDSFSN